MVFKMADIGTCKHVFFSPWFLFATLSLSFMVKMVFMCPENWNCSSCRAPDHYYIPTIICFFVFGFVGFCQASSPNSELLSKIFAMIAFSNVLGFTDTRGFYVTIVADVVCMCGVVQLRWRNCCKHFRLQANPRPDVTREVRLDGVPDFSQISSPRSRFVSDDEVDEDS
jgi:hypothetical protein